MVTRKANPSVRETGLNGYGGGESISSRNWICMVTEEANRLVPENV